MFFIIGSRNSSNSQRLVEVASQAGCKKSELIHSENELPIDKIKECKIEKTKKGFCPRKWKAITPTRPGSYFGKESPES